MYRNVNFNAPFEEMYASLPIIRKTDIRENATTIANTSLKYLRKAHTSGTSGSPLAIYRSPKGILKENAYVWYYRMSHGLNIRDRIISMRGVLDNKTFSYFNKAENTLYLSSYQLSSANAKKYADALLKFKPKAILAFPSSVFALANLLEDIGVKIDIPLVYTSSETVYQFQRERIERFFNCKLFDWYGNAERSVSLGECEHGNYHEQPLYGMADFSERGVVTTSFINRAFPLIKYYVDDSFRLMTDKCACGRGKGIEAIEGRVDDVVKLKDGTQVGKTWSSFPGVPNLKYAQIVQENIEGIKVNLVTMENFSDADQQILAGKLRQRLNESLRIEFCKIEEDGIIKTNANKFKLVISKLPK